MFFSFFILLSLAPSLVHAAYFDYLAWWYRNTQGAPSGIYKCYGTGINNTNGMWIDDRYWKGTNYRDSRHGDFIFQRDLVTGENTFYLNGTAFQSTYNAYETGLEDKVDILVASSYSSAYPGNIVFSAVYVRYKNNGIWETEWEDLGFSYTVPEANNVWNASSIVYDLRTDQGYEAYEIKVDVYVPPDVEYSSDPSTSSNPNSNEYQWWHNKHWTVALTSLDNTSLVFDPLNPVTVPEPATIVLLVTGIFAIFRRLTN